jgi:hypothetical protein
MFQDKDPTPLEKEISKLVLDLRNHEPNSEEYASIVRHIGDLQKVRTEQKSGGISSTTWVTIGANLIGILLITWFERENVVTSKALSFIPRTK